MNSNSNNFREMYWDESNRLRVVNDNDHQIQHYIYDAAGERTLKASSKIENVYENGQVESNNTTMGLYTTYVSPYMVVDANQKYSKHYFNGTQRVASKIGEQDIAIFENGNQYLKQANSKAVENTPSTDFDALKNKQIMDFSYYLSKNGTTTKNVKINYTEYKKADTNTETTSAKAADNNSAYAAQQYAEIYYYHSDHLGTGTFLSDFDGNPYQFFLNLPFGETMAEQHSYSGEYTNRYKFNGKELDEETGFYYYGARYYNPKFSIWLSTDPLAEKYPEWNPYNYTMNNPINLIDPDGREPMDHWKLNKSGNLELVKKTNDKFNVFFDESGKKLFQTNELSKEMTSKAWQGKTDEYQNKLVTTFINIAEQKNVYSTMVQRAKETGFDTKIVTLDKMKDVGETYKSLGKIQGALTMIRELPKLGVGYIYAGASGASGFLQQTAKSIYTGVNGTDVMRDAKYLLNKGIENTKTFYSDLKTQWKNGMDKLSRGFFGN